MKELIAQLRKEYEKAYAIWESLNIDTFDSDYEEDYENTVERLYNEGYSDALNMAIQLLENKGE